MSDWPPEQQRIADRIGPTWCFTHGEPLPCASCIQVAAAHPFIGRCFDCKREFATESEDADSCGCATGTRIRKQGGGFYKYP